MNKCKRCGEVNPAEIHTCSPQTKAQRLADWIDNADCNFYGESSIWFDSKLAEKVDEAADELRRLDALVDELMEALEDAIDSMGRFASDQDSLGRDIIFLDNAIAALAKAKEQT